MAGAEGATPPGNAQAKGPQVYIDSGEIPLLNWGLHVWLLIDSNFQFSSGTPKGLKLSG